MKRRKFIKTAGLGAAGAVAATTISAPYVKAQSTIKWRLQTYAGPALAAHVIKPAIDAFNKAANGEMHIELFNGDQLVPTGELFRACRTAPSTRCRVTMIPWLLRRP
jgi:TRAP-type mannitol/chloroaromatic compound transport system substrate-binding protein